MTTRFRCLVAAAAGHLLLVACGALRITPFSEDHIWGHVVETYRAYTGADNSYGFYAPGVAAEWRAVFGVHDPTKQRWIGATEKPANLELDLLISTINGLFAVESLRDLLAASWAGDVFARHPEADVVVVEAQVYILPKMADYHRGRRGRWHTAFVFAFTRVKSVTGKMVPQRI